MEVCSRSVLLVIALLSWGCQKDKVSEVFPESAEKTSPACQESLIPEAYLITWNDGTNSVVKSKSKSEFVENFLRPNLDRVVHAEQDKLITLLPQDVVRLQGDFDSPNWNVHKVEADFAWSQGYMGQEVIVAVVDSVMDVSHPQIKPQMFISQKEFEGEPGADDDGNGYVDDVYGWDFGNNQPAHSLPDDTKDIHGTHVAGIIAANPAEGPVSGAAPKAKLLSATFMSSDGGGSVSDAVEAIKFARLRGAKIVNASWGGAFCSSTLRRVMESYRDQILFSVAAGNGDLRGNGYDLDRIPFYPVNFNLSNQINTGSSNGFDFMSGFSNSSYTFVHLSAPGEGIISTIPGGYAALSGTSMAAPLVSGAAALLWSAKPTASVTEIKTALLAGVDVDPNKNMRTSTRGRLNVKKSLAYLLNSPH